MNLRRSDVVRSEIRLLEEMLAVISPGRVIERMGLDQRLERLQAELDALPPEGERIDLTFRGEPVEGSRSIVADFGGRAVAAFSDAVATIAASLAGQLGATGPLPGRAHPLRIVGPAVGSFGFELELPPKPEPSQSQLWAESEDVTALAVERAMTLIEVAGRADDEELSDYIADVHPRAATKLHEFVKLVVDRRATFNVRLRGRKSGLDNTEDGHRVLAALYMKDVKEGERTLSGRLWVLPESRQFELKTDDGAFYKGTVDRGLSEPDALGGGGQRVVAHVRETRVREARPRFTLLGVEPAGPA